MPCRLSRHDNSPSSSHLVLFRSILLTPTAIALSSLHEGPFPAAQLSPRPDSTRAACPFLVRRFPHLLPPSLPSSSMRRRRQSILLLLLLLAPASHAPKRGRHHIVHCLICFPLWRASRDSPINVLAELLGESWRLGHCSSLLLTARMLTVFLPNRSHSFLLPFSDLSQLYIHNG